MKRRKNLQEVIQGLKEDVHINKQIIHWHTLNSKEAQNYSVSK